MKKARTILLITGALTGISVGFVCDFDHAYEFSKPKAELSKFIAATEKYFNGERQPKLDSPK